MNICTYYSRVKKVDYNYNWCYIHSSRSVCLALYSPCKKLIVWNNAFQNVGNFSAKKIPFPGVVQCFVFKRKEVLGLRAAWNPDVQGVSGDGQGKTSCPCLLHASCRAENTGLHLGIKQTLGSGLSHLSPRSKSSPEACESHMGLKAFTKAVITPHRTKNTAPT